MVFGVREHIHGNSFYQYKWFPYNFPLCFGAQSEKKLAAVKTVVTSYRLPDRSNSINLNIFTSTYSAKLTKALPLALHDM